MHGRRAAARSTAVSPLTLRQCCETVLDRNQRTLPDKAGDELGPKLSERRSQIISGGLVPPLRATREKLILQVR